MCMNKLRVDFLKITKISLGCCASVLIAGFLGLSGSTSAGIITLLSIQNTKRETLAVAGKRLAAFFAAITSAYITFVPLRFHMAAFGLFLFLLTFFCYAAGLEAGISTNTVLVTHLWKARSFAFPLICNEFFLLTIGISVAVVVNLYMPRILEAIRRDQRDIDRTLQKILRCLAKMTLGAGESMEKDLDALEDLTAQALARAYRNMNNTLAVDMRYYVQYIEMRISQCALLRRIHGNLRRIGCATEQAGIIAGFMEEIAGSLAEYDNAGGLLEELFQLREKFRQGPLPQSRREFEARAVLFSIMIDLEYLLLSKKRFAESLTPWQISYFWGRGQEEKTG